MRHEYDQTDTEEILKRAIAIDALHTHDKELLKKTAEELGISPGAVEQAEKEHFARKKEQHEFDEFVAHQRRSFWSHLAAYLIVNTFLVLIDLLSDGKLEWAFYSVLGWGIGLAFHAVGVFNTRGEDFQEEFEQWRAARRRSLETND